MNGLSYHTNGVSNGVKPSSKLVNGFSKPVNGVKKTEGPVYLDGYSLTLHDVIQVAYGHEKVEIVGGSRGEELVKKIDDSVKFLAKKMEAGASLYGVTTGFGGSADTRTSKPNDLQLALLEHQLCGVVFPQGVVGKSGVEGAMPIEIVRGAMCIRVNSLVRGSISASGDLSPLSYIASSITGHPSVYVTYPTSSSTLEVIPSSEALSRLSLAPIVFGPKEGLGLINGTAVSTSAACIALSRGMKLLELGVGCTGLTVEATTGHVGSFHPFIHDVTRPHPGQVTVARTLRNQLEMSTFAIQHEAELTVSQDEGVLRQDRYPLRTSAQWLGPIVTEFEDSKKALEIELNSTTDNPLIDLENGITHHGGNFQAMSPSYAMEKVRLGLQVVGKLSFSQLTELLNASMNRGLPSCLAGGEPSTNYHCKGLDIHAAAYTSELGFLANPVLPHVQSAEMHNQAVNSLALLSARKTLESCDVLTLLLSTHLYCVCQAIDLRYIDTQFRSSLKTSLIPQSLSFFTSLAPEASASLANKLYSFASRRLDQTNSMDLKPRMEDLWKVVGSVITEDIEEATGKELKEWRKMMTDGSIQLLTSIQDLFFSLAQTEPGKLYARVAEGLGIGSKRVYLLVREEVGVKARRGDVSEGQAGESIGMAVSSIVKKWQEIERRATDDIYPSEMWD